MIRYLSLLTQRFIHAILITENIVFIETLKLSHTQESTILMTKTIERENNMPDEKALIPIEEQTVDFYGNPIPTALVDVDGRTIRYIPIRPICTYLGLAWSGQFERIQRDPVLSEEAKSVRVTRTKSESHRGDPDTLCLPVEFLNGWLFGINASRVKAELKEKVIRYQRDCYRVLWDAFNPQSPPIPDTERSPTTTALEQIRATGLAIAQWAEQQMSQESVNSQRRRTIGVRLPLIVTVDQSQLTEEPMPF